MKTEAILCGKSAAHLPGMSLDGAEAMELYLAEIEHNLATLKGEVAGLKIGFGGKKRTARENLTPHA